MKKLFLILAVLALAGCESGSYFDSNTKQLRNNAAGRLEASGEDLRIYEFTPQTLPQHRCVFVAGDKKGGLYCTKPEA